MLFDPKISTIFGIILFNLFTFSNRLIVSKNIKFLIRLNTCYKLVIALPKTLVRLVVTKRAYQLPIDKRAGFHFLGCLKRTKCDNILMGSSKLNV